MTGPPSCFFFSLSPFNSDTAEVDGLRQVDRKKKTANTLYAFMSVFSVVSPYSFESLRTQVHSRPPLPSLFQKSLSSIEQGLPDLPYFNGKPPAVLGGLEVWAHLPLLL